jgi:hypothetical protein
MNALSVVWSCRSTNGRWGAEIVSASLAVPPLDQGGSHSIRWPQRGTLTPLGTAAGIAAFRFEADDSAATWVLPMDGSGEPCQPVDGVTIAWSEGLQSGRSGDILVLGQVALVKMIGYRGRSSRYVLYRAGEREDAPTSILLALGLIEPKEAPAPIEPPPAPSGALQEALQKAGLA